MDSFYLSIKTGFLGEIRQGLHEYKDRGYWGCTAGVAGVGRSWLLGRKITFQRAYRLLQEDRGYRGGNVRAAGAGDRKRSEQFM